MVTLAGNALAGAAPARPDANNTSPIASCKLQALGDERSTQTMPSPVGFYSIQPPADDPLANYERTPLGDWQMPAEAERTDPWLRLLLITPKRPVVIDLAVFIDGKPFREKREQWIDEVRSESKNGAKANVTSEVGNKQKDSGGTKPVEATSEVATKSEASEPAQADDETKEKEEAEKDVLPGVQAEARQVPTMRERMVNYLSAVGADVDRREIGWLIAEWGAGPAVVVMGASQSWQRASVAPLLSYLDQDADGSLSAEEIGQADSLLQRADVNGDDIVDISEIRRQAKNSLTLFDQTGHSLVVLLDANTDWNSLAANLARLYEGNSDFATMDKIQALASGPADVALRINFMSSGAAKENDAAVSVLAQTSQPAAEGGMVSATGDVLSLEVGGDVVEFSAAQAPKTTDVAGSQLAIGAVIDGNPLMRSLDHNQDGRLTQRERQELAGLLAGLDRNADREVSRDELPVPIRLAVTLGPQVHNLLAKPVGAARAIAPRETSKAPEWFASMDKNSDGDLSRGEFLGTTEQFRQFDENNDGLLSAAESLKLEQ